MSESEEEIDEVEEEPSSSESSEEDDDESTDETLEPVLAADLDEDYTTSELSADVIGQNTKQFLINFHSQEIFPDFADVAQLIAVHREDDGTVKPDLKHQTLPFFSKYELSRVLGLRAKQINAGAHVFVDTDATDGYEIACKELKEKKLPFIIRRRLPDQSFEYWNANELENILTL
jgi:DNA-directed RNA polymerase I, II, and III subunit RPABC2